MDRTMTSEAEAFRHDMEDAREERVRQMEEQAERLRVERARATSPEVQRVLRDASVGDLISALRRKQAGDVGSHIVLLKCGCIGYTKHDTMGCKEVSK
jgi:hypothetical protein